MEHKELMQHAVTLATAFIQNGDQRHEGNYRDDGTSATHERVTLLLVQMYRAVEEASFLAHQTSWAQRAANGLPEHGGTA